MINSEFHGIEKQEIEDFFSLEQPYKIQLEKKEGEANLANIAREAEQEYYWAFDEKNSTWHYYPSEKHSEKISRFKGESKFSAAVSKEFLNPPSDSSIFYHIHPDSVITRLLIKPKKRWHTKEFLSVSNQMPKEDDLEVAAELKKYKEFKIITSIGITSYQFHPEKVNSKKEKFSRLTIPK